MNHRPFRDFFLPWIALITTVASSCAAGQTSPCLAWRVSGPGSPGLNGTVLVLGSFDVDGPGPVPKMLYAGGSFTMAGAVPVNGIAVWNGWDWQALGGGVSAGPVSASVEALAVFDDGGGPALYAGGYFTFADGVPTGGLAKWNGTAWSAVGLAIQSPTAVTSLATHDDGSGPALYVGGVFPQLGGARVMKWNGLSWSQLALTGQVLTMMAFDDGSGLSLYAGGSFSIAGGGGADRIAKYDGVSWSPLGTGMDAPVRTLAVFDPDLSGPIAPVLVAGGDFVTAGGTAATSLAKWNGTAWSSLGGTTNGSVTDLTVYDDGGGAGVQLIVGGLFSTIGGLQISGIARWNGVTWSALGLGTVGVHAVATHSGPQGVRADLYAGGSFNAVGGVPSFKIGEWLSVGCDTLVFDSDYIIPPITLMPSCALQLPCTTGGVFAQPGTYVPGDLTPTKNIQVNFHIFNRTDGTGNFQNTPADIATLNYMVYFINTEFFSQANVVISDPCSPPQAPHHSKIEFCLVNIYFYNNTALFNSTNPTQLQQIAFGANASTKNYLNVYFVGACGGSSGFATLPSSDRSYNQFVVMKCQDGTFNVGTLAHEFGHCLGLIHPYDGSECNVPACDYLSDLLCTGCPQPLSWGENAFTSQIDGLTNNLMGGNHSMRHITDLQMGRAHRVCSITSMQKYVKDTDCVTPPSKMGLWLPFDEGVGTTARNAAGGSNGTHVNGPTITEGFATRSLGFNGVNQYVTVPSYAGTLVGTGDFSIKAWVKRGAAGGTQVIAEKRLDNGGPTRGYSLFVQNHPLYGETLRFQMANGVIAADFGGSFTPDMPVDGAWHHVAVTVHRNDPAGGRFYIDGVQRPVVFPTDTVTGSLSSTAPFTVGGRSGSDWWNGWIDEVVLVKRVLTPTEIAACHAAGPLGMCKSYCVLPWDVPFCLSNTQVTVQAKICNATTFSQTYMYWWSGLEAGACQGSTIDGPTSFTPCTGMVTVPPGSCASISTVVARPVGMTALGLVGCLRLDVQSLGKELVHKFHCQGSVQDRRDLCVTFPYDSVTITAGSPSPVAGIMVANTGGVAVNRNYEFVVMENNGMMPDTTAVSLNGLPPGTPVTGTLQLPVGAVANLNLTVQFAEAQPLATYTLVMRDDWNGDTIFDPLASLSLECPFSTASVATVGLGCASGGGPGPSLISGLPVIGTNVTLTVVGASPASQGFLVWSPLAGVLPICGGCTLYLDLITLNTLGSFFTDGSGSAALTGTVPNDPGLDGVQVFIQGAVLDPASPCGFQLTNGLQATIGL